MLNDIPIEGARKLNISVHDLFERDLKNVLNTLEKLCHGKANHRDYVIAYDYFVGIWGPEADQLKRVPHSMGYKFGPSKEKECQSCAMYRDKAGFSAHLPCPDCGKYGS